MVQNDNELQHWGVPGMKWGVRRYQNKDGSLRVTETRKVKRQMSQDAKEVKAIKKKKVSEMSNAELRKLNDRQNLERNYKLANPNVIKRGAVLAATTAATMGTVIALRNNGKQILDIGKSIAYNAKYKQMKLF